MNDYIWNDGEFDNTTLYWWHDFVKFQRIVLFLLFYFYYQNYNMSIQTYMYI